jgi:hypothetical protein
MEHAVMCPQCNAPLAPHRFARSVVCAYCGTTVQLDEASVSAAIFHEAFRVWNSPESYQISSVVSIGDSHWELGECIAHGVISDVYVGRRARWPTELAILKLLRDPKGADRLYNEWQALQTLQRSDAPGADTFVSRIPQPILHGTISAGPHTGSLVNTFRMPWGFRHTFVDVMKAYPHGIAPRASIWIWRRILEALTFIHASGLVHGAVLPSHLLIEENEHGVHLVSYGYTGHPGEQLRSISIGFESFYPTLRQSSRKLTIASDLAMSARCIAALLGGDPEKASLPPEVPAPLARVVQRVALLDPASRAGDEAWSIREELGEVAEDVYGPPQFTPIVMPA